MNWKKKKHEPEEKKQDSDAARQLERLNRLQDRLNRLDKRNKEFMEAHEKMKAMKLKEFIEKYVTRLVVTDLRTGKTVVDTTDGVIEVDHYSKNNWLSCSDTELNVNFKEGFELTLKVEKQGDC